MCLSINDDPCINYFVGDFKQISASNHTVSVNWQFIQGPIEH